MRTSSLPDLDRRLRDLLAGDPGALADPHGAYREVRARSRAWAHDDVLVLTHHADVRRALGDTDVFSSRGLVVGDRIEHARASMPPDARAAFDEVIRFQGNFVSRTDDDDHRRLRRIAHRAFTPRHVADLEDVARAHTRDLLDDLAAAADPDGMDLAMRLPLRMVMHLLGIPDADRERIQTWSAALSASNGATTPAPFLAARDALREFRVYVDDRLARAEGDRTDLVGLLTDAGSDDRLDRDELAAMFVQLLFAGFETTAGLIGMGLAALVEEPDQWALVVEGTVDPDDVVEEMMRWVAPSQFATRLVRSDTVVGDTPVRAGQTVLAVIAAANRDPAVFDDPERFDVARADARHHLGFGFGPHFCLGAALARLEARVVLEELATRFPRLRAAATNPTFSGGAMLRHLDHLPLALTDTEHA